MLPRRKNAGQAHIGLRRRHARTITKRRKRLAKLPRNLTSPHLTAYMRIPNLMIVSSLRPFSTQSVSVTSLASGVMPAERYIIFVVVRDDEEFKMHITTLGGIGISARV